MIYLIRSAAVVDESIPSFEFILRSFIVIPFALDWLDEFVANNKLVLD